MISFDTICTSRLLIVQIIISQWNHHVSFVEEFVTSKCDIYVAVCGWSAVIDWYFSEYCDRCLQQLLYMQVLTISSIELYPVNWPDYWNDYPHIAYATLQPIAKVVCKLKFQVCICEHTICMFLLGHIYYLGVQKFCTRIQKLMAITGVIRVIGICDEVFV